MSLNVEQHRQCGYKRNNEARWPKHCYRAKVLSITNFECLPVALGIQHAKRMRRIVLSTVSCPAVPYFSTLSHKRHDYQKKKLWDIKSLFSFSLQLLSETFLILRQTDRDIIINIHRSSHKQDTFSTRSVCFIGHDGNMLGLLLNCKRYC
jgi:hypothetical protein